MYRTVFALVVLAALPTWAQSIGFSYELAAAAEVNHGIARLDPAGGVATAVVHVHDLARNIGECGLVVSAVGAAEGGFDGRMELVCPCPSSANYSVTPKPQPRSGTRTWQRTR